MKKMEKHVLKGINFTVNPGETVAFVGMSGGGKSTIVGLIPRFYDVTGGAVRIDGHDLRDVKVKSLRDQIGIVMQDSILFSDSVKSNILMGKPMQQMKKSLLQRKRRMHMTSSRDCQMDMIQKLGNVA